MTKTILLTGSGGFIGKNLKEYLKNSYNLLAPRSYELDLADEKQVQNYFKNNNIDFIIHLASVGGIRGVEDEETVIFKNIQMVKNLLKYKNENVRIIVFGSGAMYNRYRPLHKVSEDEIGKFIPNEFYGRSKLEIFNLVKDRKDTLCLNIFGCYGKYEIQKRFPTYAITSALAGKTIQINQNVVFDYLFIEDLEKIIEYFIENKPKENVLNVTPDYSISLVEIANIINSFVSNKVDVKVLNENLNFEYTGSNLKLHKEIPNIKFTTYKDGLFKLFSQIKNGL